MNRKAKLEKALAIQKLNPSRLSRQFNQGKEAENSRLAPLHEALVAAVEAMEFYGNKETYGSDDTSRRTGNKCFDIVLFDFERGDKKDYAGSRARYALSKIDKVLGDGK